LQSTRDTRLLAYLTLGFRIHHGYVGLLLLVIAARLASKGWRNLLIVAGFALFLSDPLHHFAILWFVVGAPQFDFRYPGYCPPLDPEPHTITLSASAAAP